MASSWVDNLEKEIRAGRYTPAEAGYLRGYMAEQAAMSSATPTWAYKHYNQIKAGIAAMKATTGAAVDTCTTADVLAAVGALRSMDRSPNYIKVVIWSFRKFCLWMSEERPGLNAAKLHAIKLPDGRWKNRTPESMLTKDEVNAIIHACVTSRDRALVALLYDGSNRPSEALRLNWGDLHFDEHGAWFETTGKTGRPRHIRLTISVPYLSAWKADYPGVPEGAAPVFVTLRGGIRRFSGQGVYMMIQGLRERTGIKHLTPYVFRPSRITHDVQDGYETAYVSLKNWGTLKTPMLDLYANVSGDYLDGVALEKAGIATPEEKPKGIPLKPRTCPRCDAVNGSAAAYCSVCAMPLNGQTADLVAEAKRAILEDPELLLQFVASLKGTAQ